MFRLMRYDGFNGRFDGLTRSGYVMAFAKWEFVEIGRSENSLFFFIVLSELDCPRSMVTHNTESGST